MAIIFENIDTGESVAIDKKTGGKFYAAKLSALVNSSNLSINADRGQDFGWRLSPEQQALIEQWEQDPEMIEKVSNFTSTMVDDLSHGDFLSYMLYLETRSEVAKMAGMSGRRTAQAEYDARVEKLREQKTVEPMAPFKPEIARGEATIEDFMSGDLTGDGGGDKEVEVEAEAEAETPKKKPTKK